MKICICLKTRTFIIYRSGHHSLGIYLFEYLRNRKKKTRQILIKRSSTSENSIYIKHYVYQGDDSWRVPAEDHDVPRDREGDPSLPRPRVHRDPPVEALARSCRLTVSG